MYIIKLPSYTSILKINGDQFFIYDAPESNIKHFVNHLTIECVGYKDIEKDKYITKDTCLTVYSDNIEPNLNKISILAWRGTNYFACFDKYEDALVYKALANKTAKETLIENLNKKKELVDKQLSKMYDESIILDKYPEYML